MTATAMSHEHGLPPGREIGPPFLKYRWFALRRSVIGESSIAGFLNSPGRRLRAAWRLFPVCVNRPLLIAKCMVSLRQAAFFSIHAGNLVNFGTRARSYEGQGG
jgi:hypothetical protein